MHTTIRLRVAPSSYPLGAEAPGLCAKTPTRDARIRERCVFEETITGLLSREEARHAFLKMRSVYGVNNAPSTIQRRMSAASFSSVFA